MRALIIFFGAILIHNLSLGQTADVTAGCSPLKVQFEASNLSDYYWDFGDNGTSSTDQNPEHIFTNPGVYTVRLFEGPSGVIKGFLEITVYPDPVIEITGDPRSGCSPLEVDFSSNVILDPALSITGYLWSFGDGNQSTLANPTHTYSNSGNYDVFLEITTNLTECNKTESFIEYIAVAGVQAGFNINKTGACDVPADFTLVNTTEFDASYEYRWDFGDGRTSSDYDPGSITYDNEGNYTIELSVTNSEGCTSTYEIAVSVGRPKIDVEFPEIVCIGDTIDYVNNGLTRNYLWSMDPGGIIYGSRTKSPVMIFNTPGNKSIELRTYDDVNCIADTVFMVEVEEVDASFTLDPMKRCEDPIEITVRANRGDYEDYNWYDRRNRRTLPNERQNQFSFSDKVRDSLYWHIPDTSFIDLLIETENGCIGEDSMMFIFCKPNAHFIPNRTRGCAPLEVLFSDASVSRSDIISYEYLYDTGDGATFQTPDPHSYIFTDPGEYFVKNIIVNEDGCIDTSAGVWILVGEPLSPDFTLDKTEICIMDSITVTFNNTDDRIDAWHLYTDDGRFNHCWKSPTATHQFVNTPGEFDVTGVVEYNGCYSQMVLTEKIVVRGAKADMNYMVNCDDPFNVMFSDTSINADQWLWIFGNDSIYNQSELVYSFDTTGDYEVRLEAFDTESGCPLTFEEKTIHIRDIEAHFELDSIVCNNEEYKLDASNSVDVDTDCCKGYLWYLPTRRPTELADDFIETTFPSGSHEVTLVVEDINGCTDTLSKKTRSFGIDIDFEVPDMICLPAEIIPVNNTTADTTIRFHQWLDIHLGEEPTLNFDNSDLLTDTTVVINLTVQDVVGCTEFLEKKIKVYEPVSRMIVNPSRFLCIGDSLRFTAMDYTEQGSFLNFDWELDNHGDFTGQSHSVLMDQSGEFTLSLNYEEDSSGCSGMLSTEIRVVDVPEAAFVSDADSLEPLCHPRIINFDNNSILDGPGYWAWRLSDGTIITEENPSIGFVKGEHEVELIVYSQFGCSDTTSRSYVLVGPEGEAIADKDTICIGDEITFTMINDVDVTNFEWDFGDGTTVENENPITHRFDRKQSSTARLILKAEDTGCDLSIEIPLNVGDVKADFELLDTLNYCEGFAFFNNTSEGGAFFDWTFPSGDQFSEDPIGVEFPEGGTYEVRLIAFDSLMSCTDTLTKEIDLPEVDRVYAVPNIFTPNGDDHNDFFEPVILRSDFQDFIEIKTFQIYNRWGNLIYDNDDPMNGWDGKHKGVDVPSEVYAYYLSLELIGCQILSEKGNVTLIR